MNQKEKEEVLRDYDYRKILSDSDSEDLWEDPAGHVMIFDEAWSSYQASSAQISDSSRA